MEREWKPNNTELSPACPRCGSSNTKFCYYNNYSLTQPRYFCKGCRRYWTKGGSLRNVPVGGGCRKSRRGRSIRAAAASRNSLQTSTPILDHPTCSASIDLAAVYANFLNQPPPPPENRAATALPKLPVGMNNQCLSSCFFQESNFFESGCFLGGVASAAGGNDFEGLSVLPPLPGEEAAVLEGMVWRSSEMLLHNQMLELREEMRGEEENLMMSGNLEAIFKC